MPALSDLFLMLLAAGAAGFVDAVVGGGGLVLLPALFSVYPEAPPPTLLGTNKSAAVWGTAWAARQYASRVSMNWRVLLPAAVLAGLGSFVGAWLVTQVPAEGLRQALPVLLIVVLVYTLMRKDLGRIHAPRHSPVVEARWAAGIGAGIGLYDGFFGPGTGSFLVFLLVKVLGYDFLNASAAAKLLNLSTNIAALLLFGSTGHVWWLLGLCMGAANVMGSWLGARMALRRGAGFVRGAFIGVVSALILKTAYDMWWR